MLASWRLEYTPLRAIGSMEELRSRAIVSSSIILFLASLLVENYCHRKLTMIVVLDYIACAGIALFELVSEALFINLFYVAYRYALIALVAIACLLNYLTAWILYNHLYDIVKAKPKIKLVIGHGPDIILPLDNTETTDDNISISSSGFFTSSHPASSSPSQISV